MVVRVPGSPGALRAMANGAGDGGWAASEIMQGRSRLMTCAGSAVASSSDLMRCRETMTPTVMALMIAARRLASSAGIACAICAS